MWNASQDPRAPRRARFARAIALVLIVSPLVGLVARAAAPERKTDGNPHGSFKGECGLCHGSEAWKPAKISRKFDHAKYGFALSGAHAAAECQSCHKSLDFSVEKTRCETCHADPHHAELGPDCAHCHTARSFIDRGGMVRAHQTTRFALTGSHMVVECESCHRPAAAGQMQFVGTDPSCNGCHMKEYQAAKNPDHVQGGLPTDCMICHSTISWLGGRFDHARVAGTPCATCHMTDFQTASAPDHKIGFPLECQSCHTTQAWQPATFDHATVAAIPCATCHMTDYTATTNPVHQTLGFPTTCNSCHNTTSWLGATFDHDRFFPIYSGEHRGRWDDCSDCHQTPTNYANFTCLSCHPHDDQQETDGHHRGMSGYQYSSPACLSCHPTGRS